LPQEDTWDDRDELDQLHALARSFEAPRICKRAFVLDVPYVWPDSAVAKRRKANGSARRLGFPHTMRLGMLPCKLTCGTERLLKRSEVGRRGDGVLRSLKWVSYKLSIHARYPFAEAVVYKAKFAKQLPILSDRGRDSSLGGLSLSLAISRSLSLRPSIELNNF
jgi:hypothetical protein